MVLAKSTKINCTVGSLVYFVRGVRVGLLHFCGNDFAILGEVRRFIAEEVANAPEWANLGYRAR